MICQAPYSPTRRALRSVHTHSEALQSTTVASAAAGICLTGFLLAIWDLVRLERF